jgi:septum formation protein
LKQGLIIGADTVVTCDERLLGKPRERDEAQAFLLSLAGRTHQVITELRWWRRRQIGLRSRRR